MSIVFLRNIATAAGFGVLSGCATVAIPTGGECVEGTAVVAPLNMGLVSSQKYNADCGQTMVGKAMVTSSDVGVRATGMLTLEANNPAIQKAAENVRHGLVNSKDAVEPYKVVRNPDGSFNLYGTPVITVPQSKPKEAGSPAQAASAPPTPAPAPAGP